jgi:hypothetical protein
MHKLFELMPIYLKDSKRYRRHPVPAAQAEFFSQGPLQRSSSVLA